MNYVTFPTCSQFLILQRTEDYKLPANTEKQSLVPAWIYTQWLVFTSVQQAKITVSQYNAAAVTQIFLAK